MSACAFSVDDEVGYKSHLKDPEFTVVGSVLEVYAEGTPGCAEPMLKVAGKSGLVLASHCTRIKAAPPKPKPAPHGEYEIINPSDECYLTGAGEPLAAACVILGRGAYALKDKKGDTDACPLFLLGGVDDWWKKTFGRTLSEYLDTNPWAAMADVFDTFRYARTRSSMNNIGKAAKEYATAMRKRAKEA